MSVRDRLVRETLKSFAQGSSHRTARRLRLFFNLVGAVNKMLHEGGGAAIHTGAVRHNLSFDKALTWAGNVRHSIPKIWVDPETSDLRLRKPRKQETEFYIEVDDILNWVDSAEAANYIRNAG